ncbi:MAG TPA: ABC transporter substrate-binding protein [Halanaerobiales bacterium]|nr:ABC transporter substrate-binding protein [Halanaerobiales bacterium]
MLKKSLLIIAILCLLTTFSPITQAEEPVYGGTFVDTVQTNFGEIFNPILYESSYDSQVIDLVFDGLVIRNSTGEIVPNIAKSWDFSNDGKSITFHLKEGVKFHDGHELTTEDVAYTFRTILHPDYTGVRYGSYNSIKGAQEYHDGNRDNVEGIEIIDSYTIKFTTENSDATFMGNMQRGILPAHILKDIPVADLENLDFNSKPIGSGPFKLAEYVSQQYVTLEAFEDYHKGRPYLDKYMIRKVATDSVPVYLKRGQIDLVSLNNKEQFEELKRQENLKGFTRVAEAFRYFGINQKHPLLQDKIVRQALAYGFKKDIIIQILDGYGVIANGAIPPSSWGYTDEVNKYEYNPQKAMQMLKEAGYVDRDGDGVRENEAGQELKFELNTTSQDIRVEISEIFQEFMKQIGVGVDVQLMEFNALVDLLVESKDWGMYIMGWATGPEPDMSWIFHSDAAWNDVRFYDDYNDELLDKGKTTMVRNKRKEIYKEWQNYISEELPYIFLYYPELTTVISDRLKGYNTANTRGLLLDKEGSMVHKIWIPKDKQK